MIASPITLNRVGGAAAVTVERTSPSSPDWSHTNASLTATLANTQVWAKTSSVTRKEKGGGNIMRVLYSVRVMVPNGLGGFKPITVNSTLTADVGDPLITQALREEALHMVGASLTDAVLRAKIARGES